MSLRFLKNKPLNTSALLVASAFLCLLFTQATTSNHELSHGRTEHVELCDDCKIPNAIKGDISFGSSLLFTSLSLERTPVCNTLTDDKNTILGQQSNALLDEAFNINSLTDVRVESGALRNYRLTTSYKF